MNHLSMLLLSVSAFVCLALAMARHQEDLFARELGAKATMALRAAGWVLLCGALAVALRQPSWSLGLVAWFGYLSFGAGAVFAAMLLAARLGWARKP